MLTPEQINQYRQKYSISPTEAPTPVRQGFIGEAKSRLTNVFGEMGKQFRGEDEFAGQSNIQKATGVVAKGFSAPFGLAKDVLPEPAEKGLEKVGEGIGKGLQFIAEKTTPQFMVDFVTKYPDAAKALEEAAGTVSNVGQIAGDILGIQGGVTATGKALTTVGKAVPPLARTTGRVLKGAGEGAYSVTVGPEESTRLALQTYQAKQGSLFNRVKNFIKGEELEGKPITEAETAARHGLAGTEWRLGVQAKQVADNLWKGTIEPKLNAVKGQVNTTDFFSLVKKQILKETTGVKKNQMLEAFEAFSEPYKKVGKVGLTKLQEYKESWAEFLPESSYAGKPISAALKRVQDTAAEQARKVIYKYVGEEGKQAYLDYGNLKSIMKAGIKSVSDPAKKSISRNAWEFVMNMAITPTATVGGKILYRTGEGLEFIGKKGAKKVRDAIN